MATTRPKERRLQSLGWTTVRHRAKRPSPVSTRDVLQVGEDVVIDGDIRLLDLDDER